MAHRDKFGRTTFGRKYIRRDESSEAAAPLPITLPLKIRRANESFAIEDNTGRAVCHLYFEDEESRRQQTRRFTEAEACAIAQTIARILTEVDVEQL